MANEVGWKLLQKQTYDVLSHRYGSLALAAITVLLIVSVLQFGEVRISSHDGTRNWALLITKMLSFYLFDRVKYCISL